MNKLLLATRDGLVVCQLGQHGWQLQDQQLQGRKLTSVLAAPRFILAGSTDGILRSPGGGENWTEAAPGLSVKHIRWLYGHPEVSEVVLAGTEPAAIFVSRDAGRSWRSCEEVSAMRDKLGWSLPYSSEAGCVRGFALHAERAYAAVEVGGVLRSDDWGESWGLAPGSDGRPGFGRPAKPLIHPDVHSIAVHPSDPDLVFAPTGGGFYSSADGGATWKLLYECYCRACWLDPRDPQRILLGPADGVDRNGRLELTEDGGTHWTPASSGLHVPWPRTMVERFTSAGDGLLAVLSDGRLFSSFRDRFDWHPIIESAGRVTAVDFLN